MDDAAPASAGTGRVDPMGLRIRITEIFLSLQGESTRVGLPTMFVRLTGCPLRCGYCDTAYAFHGGRLLSLPDILEQVAAHGVRHVCVTGGEPLAQRPCLALLGALCDAGYSVSLETSGALDISAVDARVSRIVDIKTPGSGEVARNLAGNLEHLRSHDELKFVVCSREDYEWAREFVREHKLDARCTVLMSPSHGQVAPDVLAQWILDDRIPVRFQMQLHKLLWGNVAGR
jgi:7-carboxy-7-deazaguanine synthase